MLRSLVGSEMCIRDRSAGAHGPADPGVDALDGVGGADDAADLRVEGQELSLIHI